MICDIRLDGYNMVLQDYNLNSTEPIMKLLSQEAGTFPTNNNLLQNTTLTHYLFFPLRV